MTLIQGTNISSDNAKLYHSLGHTIKEYRQWRKMSQQKLSESIQISVRELQNWEADRHRARIENLHDLSEFTGIPMQALISLNADQPVWYSLDKRQFKYSLIEEDQFSSRELFRYNGKSADDFLIKYIPITTDRQINIILSCHRDIYSTERPLPRDVIKKAAALLPSLNNITFDCWNHYVGHQVCLPIKMDIYNDIIKSKSIDNYLTSRNINDIIRMDEGVLFYYSVYSASVSVARRLVLDGSQSLSEIEQKERFLLATHTATKEAITIQNNMGMKLVREYEHKYNKTNPVIYEQNLDVHIKLTKPYGWLIEQFDGKAGKVQEYGSSIDVDKTSLVVDGNISNDQNENIKSIKKTAQACTNPKCKLYGKTKQGNIVSNGTYRTKDGTPGCRFLCKVCGKSFCNRTGTIFYDLRSSEDKILKALKLLLEGMPLQKAADSLGITFNTIRRWLGVAAGQSNKIDAILKKDPEVSQADLDALWAFVKNNSLRQRAALRNWSDNKLYITLNKQQNG
ncbi:helix-turn-helix domain-containing protein [Desulfobacterium sp. N47]|uniref:HTH cro/C1-type domain-containing protein n=1 Tax=uncultured Desulfobacterium sp. TaxID=201089 RepID=E1Y830_9BACT|nr:hypothetical protein N47_A07530 [uncultured Desulfobacterium sp.]